MEKNINKYDNPDLQLGLMVKDSKVMWGIKDSGIGDS